jgi:hypothetical protein
MKPLGSDLGHHDDQEKREKNQRGDNVTDLEGDS